jgi:folate-binding protein YgfZ
VNSINQPATQVSSTGLTVIKVSGADRQSFLQGQLTQDTSLSEPERPLLTGWPNAKGRLNFVAWLLNWQEALWLLLPAELADSAAQRLRMYVLRAQVNIERVAAAVSFGPADSSANLDKNPINNCFYNDNLYFFRPIAGDARGLHIALNTASGADLPAAADWHEATITAGLPNVFVATRENFVPQMLNLDLLGAISFTKGCYIGQEIVARTQHLGRIKRRMYGFTAAAATAPAASIYADGKTGGEVVNAVATPEGSRLLGVIRIDSLGEPLSLDPSGSSLLHRQALPYQVPESLEPGG